MHKNIIAFIYCSCIDTCYSMASPMTFQGKDQYISMQGDTVNVSRGPAAAMVAIKQLGTNGGGYFGANSAHAIGKSKLSYQYGGKYFASFLFHCNGVCIGLYY